MADVVSGDASIASWVQAGGVVAFATAVLFELRGLRPIMAEVRTLLASLLERERMRAERQRGGTRPPQYQHPQSYPIVDESGQPYGDDETPPLGVPAAQVPSKSRPHGYRPPGRPPTRGGG